MRELEVDFPGEQFHGALFEALPVPIFVVDKTMEIWEQNAAAALSVRQQKSDSEHQILGEALNCVHAQKPSQRCCQTAYCADCAVRRVVSAAAEGDCTSRQWARLECIQEGKRTQVNLQVTGAPFKFGGYSLIVLLLEGLNTARTGCRKN